MPEIVFKVLCANDGDACNNVKAIMKDFDIKNSDSRQYDHTGTKKFESYLDAYKKMLEIKEKAGSDLLSIQLHPKIELH